VEEPDVLSAAAKVPGWIELREGDRRDVKLALRIAADSNGDSNCSDQRQATAIGDSAEYSHDPGQLGICPALAVGRRLIPAVAGFGCGRESSWWLAGSTALAVRGARIEPGDIDLVCSGDGALGLGVIFADEIIEPVVHDANSPISDYWGRAVLGARLEWIGVPKAGVDSPSPSDFGPVAASRLETVTWEGWQLRVPPLDLQRAVSQRRGLTMRRSAVRRAPPDSPPAGRIRRSRPATAHAFCG
jgi:hypothetical protein